MLYHDRRQAGEALARRLRLLQEKGELHHPVVLGLPRGGVIVAEEVAQALRAPLDVLVVRKLGAPDHPELAVGAIAGDGPPYYDHGLMAQLHLTEESLAPVLERERAELRRRERLYRGDEPPPELAGRAVLVVDDGLATGSTARAALRAVRAQSPDRLVLAVPVGSFDGVATLRREADEIICLERPVAFGSVGYWYEEFEQVTDEQVLRVLRGARHWA
ncbi:phosphoribosyltransferase [Streptomyces sp. GC420]|uniref:phosphoribosyltransferase n=1 Tax=Streptomyces sp. GC420 TaxID=2697568 RepID=UPI001414DEF0|nr:phosphoribosyltransferase family protein [Streptomyces sp. GC420]NBM18377.1 phosphoribosyltransferase [Streptomyces sp. GC420]